MRTLHQTFPASLTAFALFASLSIPTQAVAQNNGVLSIPQNSVDVRITTLREIIEKNDSQILPPGGWHPVMLPVGSIGRGAEPDGQVGVGVYYASFYLQKDQVQEIRGSGMVVSGGIGFGAAASILYASKYQNLNCSQTARVPALPGSVYSVCTAQDITTDELQCVWFAANGFTLERIWLVAPSQTLMNKYMPAIETFAAAWLNGRARVYSQTRELTVLLGQINANCRFNGCP